MLLLSLPSKLGCQESNPRRPQTDIKAPEDSDLYLYNARVQELPSAFPSLADSDSDSENVTPFLLTSEDTALQTWQQLDSQLPQTSSSAEPELVIYGRGVALQPGADRVFYGAVAKLVPCALISMKALA